jgi:methylenetetrahydrofolate dehydrogenase (NADP+)/methenyltetrahydrofolate cyclohydrolase
MSKPLVLDGTAVAETLNQNTATQLAVLSVPVNLCAIVAGDDPMLMRFVKAKQKADQRVGMQFSVYQFESGQEVDVGVTLDFLATDDEAQGIFVELPLPQDWNTDALLARVPVSKDVDVLTHTHEELFYANDPSALPPPAVGAFKALAEAYTIALPGTHIAMVGMGRLVGKPLSHWLRTQGAVVHEIDIATPNPAEIARTCGVIVAAAGVPGLVKVDWLAPQAIVVDYGFHVTDAGVVGDVDSEAYKHAGAYTPVPGGMGPLVVAAVLENTLALALR